MPFRRVSRVSTLPSLRTFAGTAIGVALAGPGCLLEARAQTVAETASTQLPEIAVEGSSARSSTGYQQNIPSLNKLTEPLVDTPQSINVIPKQLLQDQAITTTRDALRNVPGISLSAGEAGAQGDNLTLRGFAARNDFYLDGMRDFGSYTRDPFNLQEIEVLKGPASVLFGRGSTGGVINQVSKQPQLGPVTAGTGALGTDGTRRLTLDLGRPIEGLTGTAVRLNLMGNLNGTAGRDVAEFRRFGVAPSVAFGIGTDTRLYLNYLHQQEYDTPDYGVPWFFSRPAAVPLKNFYGFSDGDYLRTNVDIGTVRFEHDFNDSISFRDQFRAASYLRSGRITEPLVNYGAGVTPATPLGLLTVSRNMIAVNSQETFIQNQADLTVRFNTGFVEHAVIGGFEIGRESSDPTRFTYLNVPRTSLLFPDSSVPFVSLSRINTSINTVSNTFGAYIMDTMKLGRYFELVGGFRWDRFDTSYKQVVAPAVYLSRVDEMPSGRAALVFKPRSNGSVYFAWGTSFNPSAETLSLATSTAGLAPEENETFEIGTKWNVLDERLSVTGAVFQIEKNNARVPDPNNSAFNILGGDQRVRGFEIGAVGQITERWQIYTGYSFLKSKVVKSTLPATVGQPLANTPENTLSLWSTYVLPWYNIQIGGGLNYVSSRIASSTPNTTTGLIETAPGYVTLQAMVKYPIRPGIDLQVNAYNITNTHYYDLLHPNHVIPGSGPAVLFSTNFAL